jgi:peptidyl-prolyl cis-trans isomerase B (cyclophilin B)
MMRIKTFFVLSLSLSVAVAVTAQVKKPAAKPVAKAAAPAAKTAACSRVKITTSMGVIIVRLYNETPQHRDNFLKLANQHFFDSLLFHRVIKGFMVQGGDPLSKNAPAGEMLGNGGGQMATIPAEFNPALLHKKGVLAAARMGDDVNPAKASSACQFYLVQGRVATDVELNQVECGIRNTNPEFSYTEEQRKIYKTIGGTPFLDMNYTVFGEIEKGLDVIDKIAAVPTAPRDRPLTDVRMKIEVIK